MEGHTHPMSVTTDSQPERGIEEALSSAENRADALFHEVRRQLTEEGLSSDQVLAALAAYRDRFQRAGDEDAEDAVVDVMNIVAGWANPQTVDALHRSPA